MHDRTNPSPFPVIAYATKHGPDGGRRHGPTAVGPTKSPVRYRTAGKASDQAVAELSRRYPYAPIWFGVYTGNYWALVHAENGTPQLIEKSTPDDLSRYLATLAAPQSEDHRPRPCSLRTPRQISAPSAARVDRSAQRVPSHEAARPINRGQGSHAGPGSEHGRGR